MTQAFNDGFGDAYETDLAMEIEKEEPREESVDLRMEREEDNFQQRLEDYFTKAPY